jgi:hypothetical protein
MVAGATRQGTGRLRSLAEQKVKGAELGGLARRGNAVSEMSLPQKKTAQETWVSCAVLYFERLLRFFAGLFAIPFPRQRFFHATLLTGLQIEGVALDFLNDVFLLDLPLEPAQCVFKGFTLLNSNFRQKKYTSRHPHVGSFMITQFRAQGTGHRAQGLGIRAQVENHLYTALWMVFLRGFS